MKKPILFLLVLAALATSASAQIVKRGNAYLFRMKFAKGSVTKYKVNSTIMGLGSSSQGMKVMIPMSWKVLDVIAAVATVEATVGPVTIGKQTMMQPSVNTVQIDNLGRQVGGGQMGRQINPTFPVKPVKVGSAWTAANEVGTGAQTTKVTATYKFTGIKTVAGKKVAELAISMKGQASGTGTMQLLVSDGSLYRSTLNMTVSVPLPNGKTSNNVTKVDVIRS